MDAAKLTSPLPGTQPSGPNLEYDAEFLALERAQQGRPEQVIGDAVNAAEPPDWPDVRDRACALFARTRDLRVAITLTRALADTESFAGLATGLRIIRGLLEEQWDTVHPELDAEDGDDPASRMNSLTALAATDGLLGALRESTVVASPTLGRFSLRAIRIACGRQPAPAGVAAPPQQLQVNAAFREASLAGLERTAGAVSSARREALAINRVLALRVGDQAPDLSPLLDDLTEIDGVLTEQLRLRGAADAPPAALRPMAPVTPIVGAASPMGEVTTRQDVVQQLERICDYYDRHEPSSPIPLLLKRAQRLVSQNFLTIVRDLTPSGLMEAEAIGGVDTAKQ